MGFLQKLTGQAALAALALMLTAPAAWPQAHVPRAGEQRDQPPADAPDTNPVRSPLAVPGFWDPRRRPERPDLSRLTVIRFLTETDYPPFNYAGPDGAPVGFNVDLARMICEEIKVACTVQMRRYDTLIDALNTNQGDAVVASFAATPAMRKRVDFSDPYMRNEQFMLVRGDENRFTAAKSFAAFKDGLVGAQAGTSPFYTAVYSVLDGNEQNPRIKLFETFGATVQALKAGDVDVVAAQHAAFAGMRIERRDSDARPLEAQPHQRLVGEGDNARHPLGRRLRRNLLQRDMSGHVADAEIAVRQHHHRTGAVGEMGQQFCVSGKLMAGEVKRFLAERRGDDRIGAAAALRLDCRGDGAISEVAGLRRPLSESGHGRAVIDVDQLDAVEALQVRQIHCLGGRLEDTGRSRYGKLRRRRGGARSQRAQRLENDFGTDTGGIAHRNTKTRQRHRTYCPKEGR